MEKINWWNTNLDSKELKSISDAFNTRQIGMGEITKKVEKVISKKLNIPYVILCSNGSSALFMSLKVLGIKEGDEVILPDRTFIAAAHAVKLTGAKVVLVDSNKKNTNININQIEKAITKNTKAIIPVHLNGRAVSLVKINKLAKKYDLHVIEDACQSLFSKNKNDEYLGTLSNIGCYSLGLAKLVTMGFGGFAVCKEESLYKKIINFRNHGRSHNSHSDFNELGFNFKISDLMSAMAKVQLSKSNEKIEHILKIYNLYKKGLKNLDFIKLIKVNTKKGELPLYVEVRSKERKKIINYLSSLNIETQLLPPSLHLSSHLKNTRPLKEFKNSLRFNQESFILPCGPNQSIKNIKKTITALNSYEKH